MNYDEKISEKIISEYARFPELRVTVWDLGLESVWELLFSENGFKPLSFNDFQ